MEPFWQRIIQWLHGIGIHLDTRVSVPVDATMTPAAAVSGWFFAHPEAQYFAVQKIGRDQLEDWAKRKDMSVAEAERWLAPIL